MAEKIQHPCFECTLPDCDDTAFECGLRVALRVYDAHRKKRQPISDEDRRRYSIAHRALIVLPWKERKAAERAGERTGA